MRNPFAHNTAGTGELDAAKDGAVLGVVLGGGESRRMGSDKALLRMGDRSWADIACESLEALGLPVAISLRAAQRAEFARRFPGRLLIVDDDRIPGPLGALLSVFAATRRSLCVLATDMPFVSVGTLRHLLEQFEALEPGARVEAHGGVCFGDERGIDPLCAVYDADALAALSAEAPKLERHDLQQLRVLLNLQVLTATETQRRELRNINSAGEYERLRGEG